MTLILSLRLELLLFRQKQENGCHLREEQLKVRYAIALRSHASRALSILAQVRDDDSTYQISANSYPKKPMRTL